MTTERAGILVIDDQETILENFARLLEPTSAAAIAASDNALDELDAAIAGSSSRQIPTVAIPQYRVRYARQGAEGVRECAAAAAAGTPFSVAFIDIHMPPGIDGVETATQLWRDQPDLEIVLCSAYSNYSWHAILHRLVVRDQLVILRKPFDPIEVRQLAACLSEKCRRGRSLARRMEQLEAQVQSEVARRMQIELQRSQKFEALGRLAAGIAHEINTPMQFIQSSVEFLRETLGQLTSRLERGEGCAGVLDSVLVEIPAALSDAAEGVARVTAIVGSVREYAHTSHRAAELVDLNRQIRMAAELARNQYKHDAELALDLGEIPNVLGNADELGRAILNLLVNAAQAIHAARTSRAGGGAARGRIGITSRATAQAITIDISDTGTGITPEDRDRVFEPFFTTKSLGQGTGQGLAIARAAIVERHHGALTFDSTPGAGTTFHIWLPLAGSGVSP
jgi:two-component system, NtrC family, sensor kinase